MKKNSRKTNKSQKHNSDIEKSVKSFLKDIGFVGVDNSSITKKIASLISKGSLKSKPNSLEENDYTEYHTWPC
tara:strand:- start:1366 stop:1584 length:219 start_codon:yes stop_codon:yes gene_type:complete